MKTKTLALVSLLGLLVLTFGTIQSAFACESGDTEQAKCVTWSRPREVTTVRPVAAVAAKATPVPPAPVHRGGAPGDAMEISGQEQTIDSGANVWYKVGSGDGPQRLEIWLDAGGKPGIGFAMYSPEQMNDPWPTNAPKGQGSFNRTEPSHDLYWKGQSPAGGTWYVRVFNSNPFPMQYKLSSNRAETERKQCISYWEYIGPKYVYWTKCD